MAERQLFDTAVASLYETVLDPTHWSVAIADLAQAFAAPMATLFSYDFGTDRAYDFRAHGFDYGAAQRYTDYYCKLDPGRSAAMAAGVGEWVADEPLLDLRSLHDQEYVRDFALPSGIGWVGGVKVSGDSQSCTWLSLVRRPGHERFGDASRHQYQALAPHLRRVMDMQSRLHALTLTNTLARACLDRLHAGIVVVDKLRRVQLVNAHGTRLLGAGRELAMSNRRLTCRLPAQDELLGHLVVAACRQPAKGGAMRAVGGADRDGLLLSVLPIPHSHELATLLPEPVALVVIGDPGADAIPQDVYRALFSLTESEAALMAALVRGCTAGEWARQRGISITTVRTQLHSLFDKTGVPSQARVVGLAKSIPPIQ